MFDEIGILKEPSLGSAIIPVCLNYLILVEHSDQCCNEYTVSSLARINTIKIAALGAYFRDATSAYYRLDITFLQ